MAGFSSTVTPVRGPGRPAWQPNPRGLIYSGKGYNGLKPPAPTIQSGSWAPVAPQAPPRLAPRPGPQTPGQTPGTSATTTTPQLDSTALNNINTNQFKVNNQINGLNQSSSNIGTNLQAALAQLAYQQPRQQLGLEQGANRQGSLYSTAYNQRLGDLNQNFLTRGNTATTNAGQRQSAIASQIQALLGGVPLYNQGQANESVARAIAAAAANPATGQPAVPPPPAPKKPTTPSTKPPAKPQKTIQSGGPWIASKPKAKAIQSGSWRRG